MNILVVSQYFWPEHFIINDLVLKIQAQGHSVIVFTGKPNYPDGTIYSGYKYKGIGKEFYNSIPIFRVPLRPRKNGGYKNLILNYVSFVFSGIKHAFPFAKNKKFDMIFVFVPSPITSVIPAIILKWLTRSHLTIWVQDLWPESIQATGFLRKTWLLNFVRLIVRGIYFFSDTILVQSEAFVPAIKSLVKKDKVFYYPNSVTDNIQLHNNVELPTHIEHFLSSYFCIVFAGNLGSAQSIETIVEAAGYLKENKEIKIVLVGSGSQSKWLERILVEKRINNLVLAGRYPSSSMPVIFSKASALLVTLKKKEIFSYTIPSKIQSYLAAGKPIVASLDGEGSRIITQSKAGFVSPAENAFELANNIKLLYDLPLKKREEMGKAGRTYFLKNYNMETQSLRLIEIFEERLKRCMK